MPSSALQILRIIPSPLWIHASTWLLLIVLWVMALLVFPKNTPIAVLHYSVGVGIDFIGESRQIIILPAIGTALYALNSLLAWLIGRASRPAAWILLGTTPLIVTILLAAVILLWRLN